MLLLQGQMAISHTHTLVRRSALHLFEPLRDEETTRTYISILSTSVAALAIMSFILTSACYDDMHWHVFPLLNGDDARIYRRHALI